MRRRLDLAAAVVLFLLPSSLLGQAIVEIVPFEMKATHVVGSDVTELSTWTVRACNLSPEPIFLDTAWVFIFSPAPVGFIDTSTGELLIRGKRRWKPLALFGRGAGELAVILTGLAAMEIVAINPQIATALVMGAPAMKKLGTWANEQSKAQEVDLSRALPSELALAAWGQSKSCVTGLAFTRVVPKEDSRKYVYEADPSDVKFLTPSERRSTNVD
jgi:hypothetical protein